MFGLHLATARLGMLKGRKKIRHGGSLGHRPFLTQQFCRPFRGVTFFGPYLGLKPQAESSCPFGAKTNFAPRDKSDCPMATNAPGFYVDRP
jgi:hypothetical protein